MKYRNTGACLAALLLAAAMTGCGNTQNNPASSSSESKAETTTAPQKDKTDSKHHITVHSVELSLNDLKAKNYTVPVCVSLDKNAGITYSEWGVNVDKRCTFTVDEETDDLAFMVYHSINEKENFMWTAWASGSEVNTKTGNLIWLNVTLPRTAAAGDSFTIEYADWSKADKPHMWSNLNDKTDWVSSNAVTWTDGTITVK